MGYMLTAMQVMGTIMSGQAKYREGQMIGKEKDYEASQYEAKAGQALAGSQRAAIAERRKGQLAMSRALAVGAASGAGGYGGTIAELAGETELNVQKAVYAGEEEARMNRSAGRIARWEGDQAREAGKTARLATILSGAGEALMPSLTEKYAPKVNADPWRTASTVPGDAFMPGLALR